MSFLNDLVNYYSKKHPQKWIKTLERAKRKYKEMDIMAELQKEERWSLIRWRKFFAKERKFFENMYVEAIKKNQDATEIVNTLRAII